MNLLSKLHKKTEEWKDIGLLLPIWFNGGHLELIDQLKLPKNEEICLIHTISDLSEAIKSMTIRGSGAIGIAGAYGMLLEAINTKGNKEAVINAGKTLKATRPTAVNLMKTVDELTDALNGCNDSDVVSFMEQRVLDILERQLDFEQKLGQYGAGLINDGDTILTHCHSGAMAGSGYGGRALSVIRKAHESGKRIHVISSETRPYLQGARITIYELHKLNIPHTLITDGMSGYLMKLGKIQKVIVGSDRVAANGDLLNKVGTYMHALAAQANGIPFYTATSSHTVDFGLARGTDMKVEFRDKDEVIHINGKLITVPDTDALYPSFDVTPNELISGIISEKGVIRPPFITNLKIINS